MVGYYEFGPRRSMGGCAGKEALIFSAFFNAALLGLFSQFYRYLALCHTHVAVLLTHVPWDCYKL